MKGRVTPEKLSRCHYF